ncbi:MAG: hypothetical protein WKF31_03965 [Thermoleophilaceae bacterium]
MSAFFVNYEDGRVATRVQLIDADVAPPTAAPPPRPWHPIRGTGDATTLWYAVMVKRERGVFIGTLSFRHGDGHALLLRARMARGAGGRDRRGRARSAGGVRGPVARACGPMPSPAAPP